MVSYNWIISTCWLILLGYWIISAAQAKKYVARRSRRSIGLRIVIIIAVVAVLESKIFEHLDAQHSNASPDSLIGALGIALCVLGIAFAIWARVHIGSNWGMPMAVQEEAELVTSGPYAYVRNPIYSGSLLAMFGTALAVGMWWLIPFAFVCIYFLYSAKQEEKLMMRQFPDTYPDYKKRTKMIIPFVL